MVRPPLSPEERTRGLRLGALLREARGQRSMPEVAAASGVPVETLRKIETGRIVTPAFFTVVALASALGLDPADLAARTSPGPSPDPPAARTSPGPSPDQAAARTRLEPERGRY